VNPLGKHHLQGSRIATISASSSMERTVHLASLGPVGRSATVALAADIDYLPCLYQREADIMYVGGVQRRWRRRQRPFTTLTSNPPCCLLRHPDRSPIALITGARLAVVASTIRWNLSGLESLSGSMPWDRMSPAGLDPPLRNESFARCDR